jgi:hypothetical protein
MFCPNPFKRMEVKANGDVYCCCEGWLPRSLGNVLDVGLLEIWEGEVAREVRASVEDGSFRYCTACPFLPGPRGPVVSGRPADLCVGRVGVLKLDYDQSCNLTCPSCRVEHSDRFVDSSKVREIHEDVLGSGVLERVDQVYLTGAGDPFASPSYWPMLQSFPKLRSGGRPKLFLHTNGQLFDEAHWEAMADAQDMVCGVGISVDAACEETYRLNRRASWGRLWKNVAFVNGLQEERGFMLGMFFTVQANNFREIIPFTRLAFNHRAAWINVMALRNWGTYSAEDYRQRAVHVPGHPQHEQFREVIGDERLRDPRILLDSFEPKFNVQAPLVPGGTLAKKEGVVR